MVERGEEYRFIPEPKAAFVGRYAKGDVPFFAVIGELHIFVGFFLWVVA